MNKIILCFTSDMGYWCDSWDDMRSNTSFFVDVTVGDALNNKHNILSISGNDYVPQNGDRVHFLPGVNVPRIKFKNLCDEKGIRTVRDASKANVFVGNNNTLNKLSSTEYKYKVKAADFKALAELEDFLNTVDGQHHQKIMDALQFYIPEYVYVDRPTAQLINKYITKSNLIPDSEAIIKIASEHVELLTLCQNSTIYDESTVIDQLNGDDAAIIDHNIYEQLCIMLDSADSDNTVLAMEIMANCKYSASLVHLIVLFYKYGSYFHGIPNKNHVNFKSLLSWLNLSPGSPFMSTTDTISLLKEKGQLVPEKLDLLFSYLGNEVARLGSTPTFSMKQITLNPELLAEMGVNYSYQLQEDYIPPVKTEDILIEEDVVNEGDFATEDNFELEGPEEEGHILEESIEADIEEVELESISELELNKQVLDELNQDLVIVEETSTEATEDLITPESLSNNDQIKQTNESDFEWF